MLQLGTFTSTELTPDNDEYVCTDFDPLGEQKVNADGHLLGGREYVIKTFTLPGRGYKLYMMATECAKELNYRDSYLLYNKNKSLYKLIATSEEKEALISSELLPYSFRSRQIALVTARSMFRQFGSRIIKGGKRVLDDYWEGRALSQGFKEGDPIILDKRELVAHQNQIQQQQQQQHGMPDIQQPGMVNSQAPAHHQAQQQFQQQQAMQQLQHQQLEMQKRAQLQKQELQKQELQKQQQHQQRQYQLMQQQQQQQQQQHQHQHQQQQMLQMQQQQMQQQMQKQQQHQRQASDASEYGSPAGMQRQAQGRQMPANVQQQGKGVGMRPVAGLSRQPNLPAGVQQQQMPPVQPPVPIITAGQAINMWRQNLPRRQLNVHEQIASAIPSLIAPLGQTSASFVPGADITGYIDFQEPVGGPGAAAVSAAISSAAKQAVSGATASPAPGSHKSREAPKTEVPDVLRAQKMAAQFGAYVNKQRITRKKNWQEFWLNKLEDNNAAVEEEEAALGTSGGGQFDRIPISLVFTDRKGGLEEEKPPSFIMPDPPVLQRINQQQHMSHHMTPQQIQQLQLQRRAMPPGKPGLGFSSPAGQFAAPLQQQPFGMQSRRDSVNWRGQPGAWNNYH